ncbi:hypothetical protein ADUPG1_009300, partial [Aduncisulcus paluster]
MCAFNYVYSTPEDLGTCGGTGTIKVLVSDTGSDSLDYSTSDCREKDTPCETVYGAWQFALNLNDPDVDTDNIHCILISLERESTDDPLIIEFGQQIAIDNTIYDTLPKYGSKGEVSGLQIVSSSFLEEDKLGLPGQDTAVLNTMDDETYVTFGMVHFVDGDPRTEGNPVSRSTNGYIKFFNVGYGSTDETADPTSVYFVDAMNFEAGMITLFNVDNTLYDTADTPLFSATVFGNIAMNEFSNITLGSHSMFECTQFKSYFGGYTNIVKTADSGDCPGGAVACVIGTGEESIALEYGEFSNCTSVGSGAVFHLENAGSITFTYSAFEDNECTGGDGGALYLQDVAKPKFVNV